MLANFERRIYIAFQFEQVTFPVVGMVSGTVFAASEAKQKNDTLMTDEVCLLHKHLNSQIMFEMIRELWAILFIP